MQIQASIPGIQRELPQVVQNKGITDGQRAYDVFGNSANAVQGVASSETGFVEQLKPFVPSGLARDSFQASAEGKQRVADELLSSEVSKKVAEQFSNLDGPSDPSAGYDFSPEGTADRIARFATGLFQAWRQEQPEGGSLGELEKFSDRLRSGVRRGFREALDNLQESGADERSIEKLREAFSALSTQLKQGITELELEIQPDAGGDPVAIPHAEVTPKRPSLSLLDA